MKSLRNLGVALLAIFGLLISAQPAGAIDLGTSSNYLIRVTPEAKAAIENAVNQYGGKVNSRYQYVFDGFLVRLPDVAATALKKLPSVLTIEKDEPVQMSEIQSVQTPAPSWGLDRIDQREPVNSNSSYGYRSAGRGSTVYVVDTGIFPHQDFGNRLSSSGFSAFTDGNGSVDCNGHGTHVAGTIAGTKFGIAKFATLVPVRVLSCSGSGTYSQVIAGMEWILSPENPNSKLQAIVNMSLGGGASSTIDAAVTKLTNSGIAVVVAAGNDNNDACLKSPARAPSAITVGATTISDAKSTFSNFGACVDIHAPGTSITSDWIGSQTATSTISGTSMASPHVAGAAAVYLGLNAGASVAQVAQFLDAQATRNVISGLPAGTVNELLYVSPSDGLPMITPPTVALKSVSEITHQSAKISIDVNPGNAVTSLELEYSPIADMSSGVIKAPVSPSTMDPSNIQVALVNLTGLSANSTVYFKIIGRNESGVTSSPIGNFKTLAPPKTLPIPNVVQPTSLTAYSATLQGTVNPGNDSTQVSFVYGTDPNFKDNTNTGLALPATVSGGNPVAVSLPISFLKGDTNYYVKLVSSNSSGSASSPSFTFKTPISLGKPPLVTTTQLSTSINYYSQNFAGSVNPQGQTTEVSFVYGKEKTLTTGITRVKVATSPITGEVNLQVSALIEKVLNPGTGYYYQFVASNDSGVTKGDIRYSIVSPIRPVVVSAQADNSKAGQLTFITTANGGGANVNWTVIYGTSSTLVTGDPQYPTLAPGAIEIKLNPAVTTQANASNTTASITVTGLANGTKYYFLIRLIPYTGEFNGQSFMLAGETATLNVGTPTPTPSPTPTTSPTPTPTPTTSPTPTPTPISPNQVITFPPLPSRFVDGVGTPLLATSSSGLPVTYSVEGPCQILDLGAGKFTTQPKYPISGTADSWSCKFTANQAGNATFSPANPVSQVLTFTRSKVGLNLTKPATISTTGVFVYASYFPTEGRDQNIRRTEGIVFSTSTPDTCSISEQTNDEALTQGLRITVRAKSNGSCIVQADFPGNATYKPANAIWSITVAGLNLPAVGSNASQTITFPRLWDTEFGPAQTLNATASSGLLVTYVSLTPNVCFIVAGASTASVQSVSPLPSVASFDCTVRATQSGDSRFAPALPIDRSFKWMPSAMNITISGSSRFLGKGPHSVSATINFVDPNKRGTSGLGHLLQVTSLTPNTCTVASNVIISATGGQVNQTRINGIANGDCQLRYDFSGTADRAATTRTWSTSITGFEV
jgi:hypothetical protein